MSSNNDSLDPNFVEIEDGMWDFYSGLPNPKWYETFSNDLEEN